MSPVIFLPNMPSVNKYYEQKQKNEYMYINNWIVKLATYLEVNWFHGIFQTVENE